MRGDDAVSPHLSKPMTENAGRNLAHLARMRFLEGDPRGRHVADHVGELYVADIGVPPELYAGPGLGLKVSPLFAEGEILRLS